MLALQQELRKKGVHLGMLNLGGRREAFTDEQICKAEFLIEPGKPTTHVARKLGISRATLYRRINNLG